MTSRNIIALLEGGDRRSIGRSEQVVTLVLREPRLFGELLRGLWSADPLVRMRTVDAAEKITRANPELIQPHKKELLGLMAETAQEELRWHLALMVPRLMLTVDERQNVVSHLWRYLEDRSSIVKTCALQAFFELAQGDPSLRTTVVDLLRQSARGGTAAMKARSRKLLTALEADSKTTI
jgi:hypothetical protein